MNRTYEIIRGTIILIVVLAVMAFVLVRWLKRSRDEPAVLITKWAITAPLVVLILMAIPWFSFLGPILIAVCGIALSLLWTPNLATWCIKPLTSIIDGGDDVAELRPFYSAVRALRNKGKYLEAQAAVRHQLDRFPNDLEGVLLLAAIQAENLADLPGAEVTLSRFCNHPGIPPPQIAAALHQLADWHLKLGQDSEAARLALDQIITRFPETEFATQAAQRIAHLASTDYLLGGHEPETVTLKPGIQNLGLLRNQALAQPVETAPEELAAQYVKQLETHPFDTEAREKLAALYAQHYGRLDLATDQIEQLVRAHQQSPKQVARWLHLLAELQINGGADYETVRQTIQMIIDLYPDLAIADAARTRLDHLRLEFKRKEKSQAVKLGSYEQNIGLKMKPSGRA